MKRLLILCLILTFIISTHAFATSTKNESTILLDSTEATIISYVKKEVTDSYSGYYTIPKISVHIEQIEKKEDTINALVHVNFEKLLKAESAFDLPYVQGLLKEQKMLKTDSDKTKSESYIKTIVKDLEDNYIGVLQGENAHFKVSIPNTLTLKTDIVEDDMNMVFVGDFGYTASMKEFCPPSEVEMMNEGIKQLKDALSTELIATTKSSATDYDRVDARNYIRSYTDACGDCCCSSCNSSSPYNSAYTNYHDSDCANYVSQAIYAGGISTDSTWAPGKIAWINTGYSSSYYGLVEYMEDEGYFFDTTSKNKAFAGSIIYWTGFSHVGMVDQNDTVTMTYCAHTNDRYQTSFKYSSGIKFWVPVWDSYSGQYTPQ